MAPNSQESSSNIRVFVRWHEQVVFAGEEVKCTITFRNVARTDPDSPNPSSSALSTPTTLRPTITSPTSASSRHPHPLRGRTGSPSITSPGLSPPPPSARGHHRSSLSVSVPSAASRARSESLSWLQSPSTPGAPILTSSSGRGLRGGNSGNGNGGTEGRGHGHSHKRSVSIVSIGSLNGVDDAMQSPGLSSPKPPRARGHARASSLQILPRGGVFNGPRSATHSRISGAQSSPLFHASYPPDRSMNGRRSGTATTPGGGDEDPLSPTAGGLQIRTKDAVPTINEQGVTPAARVLSTMSIAGTPRSSGEFYSLSNHSSETLASEYVTQQPLRTQARSPLSRWTSAVGPDTGPAPAAATRQPESLMMGYAQIQGSFTLDGSLVNLGPFEAVKRKAVVGGQGGGVVGLEPTKRDSGLLRGFGWGAITSSIGELLGGGELSTIKEMRGIANSKAVPLLSTPQSILFVDLQLAPGDSRSFEYTFRLPKGLPPTHRGKAMKISYSLVIGTQRPGSAREQRVKSVEVPFRVLGSVNNHGEILGHDLMSPYIILRDQAQVRPVNGDTPRKTTQPTKPPQSQPDSTISSFLTYVDELLSRPRHNNSSNHGALLSPSIPLARSPASSRRPSTYSLSDNPFLPPPTAKEAIDLAILRSNFGAPGSHHAQQAPNRFEIARNGRRVGVVMLTRPAYRLGEVVTCAVDFSQAQVRCYAVHAALETTERVDASLALRSEASVARVTRRVWASASEACLFTRRFVFAGAIPATATPEFVTSGVSMQWKLRLEFVVPVEGAEERQHYPVQHQQRQQQQQVQRGDDEDGDEEEDEDEEGEGEEEISHDDRGGQILVGVETLPACESFEVAVPIKVYGAVCDLGVEKLERDEVAEVGLVV
ncbi:hypothetical protein VTJ49DRAFT_6724 [Mycothermus thermophilus]|uniref:Rgp1-domain-containing protein n=1 Tax=Humicola insolens TaxID=85995 RepID=A0ABR3VIP2_HUMIN